LTIIICFGYLVKVKKNVRTFKLAANGLQLRDVGLFKAFLCQITANITKKNQAYGIHRTPHVFLGAVGRRLYI